MRAAGPGCPRLVVSRCGAFELSRGAGGEEFVARGRLGLPAAASAPAARLGVSYGREDPGDDGHPHYFLDIAWGDAAHLRVHASEGFHRCAESQRASSSGAAGGSAGASAPPPPAGKGWARNLGAGFVLEFAVRSRLSPCAEVALDVDSAGSWFGGAHLMRQLWPLNGATWELGPYVPFDNGPTGLNTLVAPQFTTSSGLLALVDPDTPFLHVGMNTPVRRKGMGIRWFERHWGVGVQNLTREYLPREKGGANGHCGQLRLQSRESYEIPGVHHPLRDWGPWLHPEWKPRPWGTGGGLPWGAAGGLGAGAAAAAGAAREALAEVSAELVGSARGRRQERRLAQERRQSAMREHPWRSLTIALCPCGDVRAATEMALGTHEPPGSAPHPEVLRDPIWTTWARYHKKVDQGKVLRYAREICDRGLGRSVMEIDDMWQTRYGDLAFNRKKFPDPKAMVNELHALGFRVTLWVMPFAEEHSEAFRFGAPRGYFIRGSGVAAKRREGRADPHGRGHFFNWWNQPRVAALDVTNPEAVAWFVGRLKALQAEVGVDGFKFDGGEPCFLPRGFRTHAPIAHPSEYSELYVREVAGRFEGGSFCEVRTGHRTQNVGVLTRMGDRFSTWGVDNGLRSIIPTLLTSGLLGYPFCLPDMVGGNAYFGVKPDRELLVRWMQASAFMPSLQISIPPWDLDEGADQLCKQALEARAHVLGDIGELARGAAGRLTPIARPMWWLDPRDPETFGIDDQFALGDDLIVAPVVEKGARARDVYLTEGAWRDLLRGGEVVQGGRWLRGHDAPLHHIPCFARVAAPPG